MIPQKRCGDLFPAGSARMVDRRPIIRVESGTMAGSYPVDPHHDPRAERWFRLLAEAIPQIVWTTSSDGHCDYTNRRWSDYSGMTAEESSGVGWLNAVHPEDRARFGAEWTETLQKNEGFAFEYRLRRADGVFRWFLARGEPIRDDAGRVVRWFGTCTDIDDHKSVEDEALRRNGERLRLAAEAARLGYWDWDIVSDSITWSDSLSRISGTTPERFGLTFEGFLGLVHPDDRDRVAAPVRRAVAEGTPYEEELKLANPDGTYRWGLTRGQVYYDRMGRPVRMSGIEVDISARKQTERALQQSLEFSRRIAEISPAVLYVYDLAERRSLYTNREVEAQLGYTANELLGMRADVVSALMHPEDQRRHPAHLAKVCTLQNGEKLTFEYRMKDANDDWHWYFAHDAVFARDAQGRATQLIGAAIDITAQRRTEAALRGNEQRFRAFADSDIIGVIFGDIRGGISYANDEYLRIIGYTREQFESGRIGWADVTPPDWLPTDEEAIVEAKTGDGSCRPYEKEYVRRDGTRIPVLVGFTLFGKEETVAFILDISERKRAEREIRRLHHDLEQRASLLQTLFEVLPVGVGIAEDPACRFVRINPAMATLLRIPVDANGSLSAPVGERPATFKVFQDGKELTPDELPMQISAARGVEFKDVELDVVYPDGSSIKLLEYVTPLRDQQGNSCGCVGAFLDITSRTQAEAALREADRRKDEFLAMLAHELRNPLSAISAAISLFRDPGATAPDLQWASEVAERQLRNLVRLIDDLLDVSRISRGKIQLVKACLDASAVVERAVEAVRPFMAARRHELTVSLAGEPMPLEGDPTRLEQVLTNLLNNAAKYTDEGGHIALVAGLEEDEVVIRVRDDGVGIAAEMLPKVFDLFAQVDGSVERSHGGLGIGLTLVRSLVEMHGGRVVVESDGPGLGTEFTVRLPRLFHRSEFVVPPAALPLQSKPGQTTSRRILVVDDNVDALRGMARLLGRSGHEVLTAEDGHSALVATRDHGPEVVILDIGLPGMSGYDVAQAIRRQAGAEVILIALSGYAQERDRQRSTAAGFDHHLAKPLNYDELRVIIEASGTKD
jgi:PAS domain S-box-containing protein